MPLKPNILLITSDQHRADAMGCAGHPSVRTPHLDKLAQQGTRFTRAYSDCPVCIPARTTLVTGVQSHIYGKPSYAEDFRIDRPRELFLGSLMTHAGYQTQLVGKTHWHTEPSFRGGFEHVLSEQRYREEFMARFRSSRGSDPTGIGMNEPFPDLNAVGGELNMTNWVIDHSIEFLRYRDRTQPFFLWASFVAPHPPNTIHEPYYSMYDHEEIPDPIFGDWYDEDRCPYDLYKHRMVWNSVTMTKGQLRKARGVYYGMVTHMDHQLGRLLGALQNESCLNDTWIVYASDHGEMLGDHGDMGKSTFLERSTNIPLLIVPPASLGIEPGAVCDALVGLDDLLPTFCEIAGVKPPSDLTGYSLHPLLRRQQERIRDAYHGQIEHSHMYLDGKYKYLYCAEDGRELLFDMSTDRDDRTNLAGEEALLAPIRERFIAHLQSEQHPHIDECSQLLNLHTDRLPDHILRAFNVYGWH